MNIKTAHTVASAFFNIEQEAAIFRQITFNIFSRRRKPLDVLFRRSTFIKSPSPIRIRGRDEDEIRPAASKEFPPILSAPGVAEEEAMGFYCKHFVHLTECVAQQAASPTKDEGDIKGTASEFRLETSDFRRAASGARRENRNEPDSFWIEEILELPFDVPFRIQVFDKLGVKVGHPFHLPLFVIPQFLQAGQFLLVPLEPFLIMV